MIEASAPGVPVDDWIWNSKWAQAARVAGFRGEFERLVADIGLLKLERAILLRVSADHFFVERRRATTFNSDRFAQLLERLFGRDGETRPDTTAWTWAIWF